MFGVDHPYTDDLDIFHPYKPTFKRPLSYPAPVGVSVADCPRAVDS